MNCLDCATTHTDRAVVRARHLTRTAVINRQVSVEPAARVFRCRICDAARVAQHDGQLGTIYEPVTATGARPARVA